jgi:hypothetical protein
MNHMINGGGPVADEQETQQETQQDKISIDGEPLFEEGDPSTGCPSAGDRAVQPRGHKLSKQDLNRGTSSLALNGTLKMLIHERRRQVLRGVRGDNMKRGTMQNFLSNLTRPMPGQES